jgi:hypothetical protein
MDAVAEAKRRAGLAEDARVALEAAPDAPTLLGQLLGLIGLGGAHASTPTAASTTEDLLSRLLGPTLRGVPGSLLLEPSVPQARLDFSITAE